MYKFNMYQDYNITRERFVELFIECHNLLCKIGWNFCTDEYNCFCVCDTYYMLELDTGILISYYKYLGRSNSANFAPTEFSYEDFSHNLLEALKSKCS